MPKYSNLIQKLKPSQSPPATTETQTENSTSSETVFDLSEHLKQKAPPTAPAPTAEEETETTTATPDPEPATDFEDVERAAINTLLDPQMIAEGLADIADLTRQMFYPSIYERLMFKPNEKALLKNPAQLKPDAVKFLNDKLEEFNGHVKKIEWETGEKLQMIKHIFRPLAEKLGPDSALTKYYPLLIVAAIEGKRFKAVANSSNAIFVQHEEQPEPEQRARPKMQVNQEPEQQAEPEANQEQEEQYINLQDYKDAGR